MSKAYSWNPIILDEHRKKSLLILLKLTMKSDFRSDKSDQQWEKQVKTKQE